MKWEVMDCRALTYPDETFDVIFDKSTLDALVCSDWSYMNVALMMKECQRVLKTGGFYVAVSFGAPETREWHLLRKHLKFELKTVKMESTDPNNFKPHYMFVCRKLEGAE